MENEMDGYAHAVAAWNRMRDLFDELQIAVNREAFLKADPRKTYEAARRSLRIARLMVADLEKATGEIAPAIR